MRDSIREIPIAIQDRSFNEDGSLFYPDNRAFFEELNVEGTTGTPDAQFPGEPELQIELRAGLGHRAHMEPGGLLQCDGRQRRELAATRGGPRPLPLPATERLQLAIPEPCPRLRLEAGPDAQIRKELPFIQIGAEQGFLRQAVGDSDRLRHPAGRGREQAQAE